MTGHLISRRTVVWLGWVLTLPCLGATLARGAETEQPKPGDTLTITAVEGELALYETLSVGIRNLDKWLDQPGHDASKFLLCVDGHVFTGLKPTLSNSRTALCFALKRTTESEEAWLELLSRPKHFQRQVSVTVRQEGVKVQGEVGATMIVVNRFWFVIFVICFVAGGGLFIWLAIKSDMLRDSGPQPDGVDQRGRPLRKPYSLARTQMAVWFFVVLASYMLIWMVTSNLSSLTPTVLGLIGISAATGLSAVVVDVGKRSDKESQRQTLEQKNRVAEVAVQKLTTEIAGLQTAVNANPPPADVAEQQKTLDAKRAELAAKQTEITQATQQLDQFTAAARPAASQQFLADILSDDVGICFHRFQIFAWTIALVFIFVASVYNSLSMPDFDATLLGLMGISGGTYIGFKLPPQQS